SASAFRTASLNTTERRIRSASCSSHFSVLDVALEVHKRAAITLRRTLRRNLLETLTCWSAEAKTKAWDRVTSPSADAEADVADGFGAEALFQFSQDLRLGDLFQLVVQCGLEHADVQHAFAQRDRSGVYGDEVADDF